jgi:hypothetical protein
MISENLKVSTKIYCSVFESLYDNKTDKQVIFNGFDEFEAALYLLSERSGAKRRVKEPPIKGKKYAPLISPAIYATDTTRANKNVLKWSRWAAVDIDNITLNAHETINKVVQEMVGDSRAICYSTASSTKTNPKFRLVFSLSREIDHNEIEGFFYALNTKLGNVIDRQTKDLARMFYVPAKYEGCENSFIFSLKGKDIDVDGLMTEHPYNVRRLRGFDMVSEKMQEEIIAYRKSQATNKDVRWSSYKTCPFVHRSLVNEYRAIAYTDGTGRYAMIYKMMCSIARAMVYAKYPANEFEIVELIREIDRDCSNLYQKRSLGVEAKRAIEFAYQVE